MPRTTYTVSLIVTVTDEAALHAAAVAQAREDSPNITDAELADMLGSEAEPDVHGCLRMLADPGVSWDGTEIEDSTVEAGFTDDRFDDEGGFNPDGPEDDDGGFTPGDIENQWVIMLPNDAPEPGRAELYVARFSSEARAADFLSTSATIDPDRLKAGDYSLTEIGRDVFVADEPVLWLKDEATVVEAEVVRAGEGSSVYIKGEGFTFRKVQAEELVSLWENNGRPRPEIGRCYQLAYPFFGAAPDGLLADTMTYPEMTERRGELVRVLRWATLKDCDREAMPQVIIGDPDGGDTAFNDPDFEGIATLDELTGPGMTKEAVVNYVCDHFHDGLRPSPTTPVVR